MSTDGLDLLNAQRAKRSQKSRKTTPPASVQKSARIIPPPQHTPKPRLAASPASDAARQASAKDSAQAPATAPAPSTPVVQTAEPELRRVTVYLEAEAADFLDAVLLAGRPLKPRVNSASAVIRLAISRLAEQTSAQDVAEMLRDRAAAQGSQSGRKRV